MAGEEARGDESGKLAPRHHASRQVCGMSEHEWMGVCCCAECDRTARPANCELRLTLSHAALLTRSAFRDECNCLLFLTFASFTALCAQLPSGKRKGEQREKQPSLSLCF